MKLHIHKNTNELSLAVAGWMADYITSTLEKKDRFTLALSGGSTPKILHTILAGSPFKEKIDWPRLLIFWGDERAVPFEDERNNARMAYDTLLDHVPVPAGQVHVMRTDIGPEAAAAEYDKLLRRYFDDSEVSFDLVLLGMGDDGHTLSLFPGTEIIHEQDAWAKAFYLDAQQMYRISLTAPVVNKAGAVLFLTAGANKAHTLKQVLEGAFQPDVYPSQVIRPESGELHWFIDASAAAELDNTSR
jgi:6-phosphogluconolactonase